MRLLGTSNSLWGRKFSCSPPHTRFWSGFPLTSDGSFVYLSGVKSQSEVGWCWIGCVPALAFTNFTAVIWHGFASWKCTPKISLFGDARKLIKNRKFRNRDKSMRAKQLYWRICFTSWIFKIYNPPKIVYIVRNYLTILLP